MNDPDIGAAADESTLDEVIRRHFTLTVSQAAKLLDVSAATLRNWERQGKLIPRRHPFTGYRLYDRREIEARR